MSIKNRSLPILAACLGLWCPSSVRAEDARAELGPNVAEDEAPSAETPRDDPPAPEQAKEATEEESPRRLDAAFRRRRIRSDSHEKNAPAVKAAFREVVAPAAGATVRILADGWPAALGTVVDTDGYVVTKASLLENKLTCRLPDGRVVDAEVIGTREDFDLAVLRIEADNLAAVSWRSGAPPPAGSWVATVGPGDEPLAIGVVSAEPRRIRGSTRPDGEQGLLGIRLSPEDSGPAISHVDQGSAAEKAGLQVADRIKSIDGTAMRSVQQVVETVGSHQPGETIVLVIHRDEEELEVSATLGKAPRRRAQEDRWGGGPFSRRRYGFPTALPHDTVVHPNDCGGPLVDTDGKVVGINIARALRVVTYAVPAGSVQKVVEELMASARREAESPEE